MTLFARHGSFICLLGFACLIVSTEVRAQSQDDTKKRSFAELLARRAKALKAESRREIAAADRTAGRTAGTTSLARSPAVLLRNAVSAANAVGVASATPLIPSGFGAGRDAFTDSLFPGILGRNATQAEEDYFAGILARGVSPNVVATIIWDSQEHRTELRMHTSPGVPYNVAYRYALFIGDKAGHK